MLDPNAITRMVEEQIAKTVNEQTLTVLSSDEWLESLEKKILQYTQDRILSKFANASTMPEIVDAVKDSVGKLFDEGKIPGVKEFVDSAVIKATVDHAVEQMTLLAVEQFGQDPQWQARVETQINQAITQNTLAVLGSIDLNPIIKQRVDDNMKVFQQDILKEFASTGINDQATACQLTVTDETVIVENCLTAHSIDVVESATIQNLVVKGSINTDNFAWSQLSADISQKTLDSLTDQWQDTLVNQVATKIATQGIDFKQVTVDGIKLVDGNRLSKSITQTNIQVLGTLDNLAVTGDAHIGAASILKTRMGINTATPDMALSVWDEEVSVGIGKFKNGQAYIGTSRLQSLAIGVNRQPQIEIDADGLTKIKKLQLGLHKISHDTAVPGWSGTRGDIVFNSNPGADLVFAWVCLGAYKWQPLKSA